jgi:hypothetical protein
MRVPDRLITCVGFISEHSSEPRYIGTAFIVGVPGRFGNAYVHAVTAKHVAECVNGKAFMIGVNCKDGEAGWFGSKLKWWYHPTESSTVDVAVTVFTPTERFDVEYVPESIFATDNRIKQYGIGVGRVADSSSSHHTSLTQTDHISGVPAAAYRWYTSWATSTRTRLNPRSRS